MKVLERYRDLSPEEQVFIGIAIFFLCGALLFILFLVISRLIKRRKDKEENKFKGSFQSFINDIIFIEDPTALATSVALISLRKLLSQSSVAKQVFINQVITLRKSLSGMAAQNLERAFHLLGMHEFSMKKLAGTDWETKAEGIYELAEMNHQASRESIMPFLVANKQVLREEAFMALLKLDKDTPLLFLDEYKSSLPLWMRLRIHNHLSHSDKRRLPDFSRWFTHSNPEVVLFAMSMARQFRQLSAAPKLVSFLRDRDRKKVNLAIVTLGDLGAHEYADELANISEYHWKDAKLSQRIARSLGKVANTDSQWRRMTAYLQHPDYFVRFETAQVLHQTGNGTLLKSINVQDDGLRSLAQHVEEPLLQPT